VNPDLTVYFPISFDRVLVLTHDHRKYARFATLMKKGRTREANKLQARAPSISYRHISKATTVTINNIMIERALRWVYAPVEMSNIPSLFRGESRNVRVEMEPLGGGRGLKMTHRIS
jgi:hypothetical protein